MDDCCGVPQGSARYSEVFDTRFAGKVARRYVRKGPTPAEQAVIEAVVMHGVAGRTVLEIGGGVGEIQLELLARGAARTTNYELSGEYETRAAELIERAGVASRVTRFVGVDLAARPDAGERSDIVILHRVVCCYPDVERLLASAAEHAERLLVFSHPPRTAMTRLAALAENALMRVLGRSYRGYIHSPAAMIAVVERHGLHAVPTAPTRAWKLVTASRS